MLPQTQFNFKVSVQMLENWNSRDTLSALYAHILYIHIYSMGIG